VSAGSQPGSTSRNPVASLLASLLLPGLGTIINGETGKGILILIVWITAWILVLFTVGVIIVPAVWIYAMYDAFRGARRYNVAHAPPMP
jgi:TM2 domain-containing membrane protein YozV